MSTIPSLPYQPRLAGWAHPRPRHAARILPELSLNSTDAGQVPSLTQSSPSPHFLSPANISAGTTVMLQGLEPETYEAVLRLTVGRGGKFIQHGVVTRYQPSGEEPACIVVRGQSGRPALANSASRFDDLSKRFWQPYRRRLQQLRSGDELSLCQDLWPILSAACAKLLDAKSQPTSASEVEHWFRGWSRYRMTRVATARAMLQSTAVATGIRPIDIPAGLGEVWRQLQADLKPILSSGRWQAQSASRLQRFVHEMERISHGPSAETLSQLLGLIRCRLLVTASEGEPMADVLRWAEKGAYAQTRNLTKR